MLAVNVPANQTYVQVFSQKVQPHLRWQNQVLEGEFGTFVAIFLIKSWFSCEPNQVFFVSKPNQRISQVAQS